MPAAQKSVAKKSTAPAKTAAAKKAAVKKAPAAATPVAKAAVKKTTAVKSSAAKSTVKKSAVTKTASAKTAVKKTVPKTAAKKAETKKVTVKKVAEVKKTAVKKAAPAVKKVAVKKSVEKKSVAKNAAAPKVAEKKAAVKKSATKVSVTKKAATTKAVATKKSSVKAVATKGSDPKATPVKKTAVKKTQAVTKSAAAEKTVAKKSSAKKAAPATKASSITTGSTSTVMKSPTAPTTVGKKPAVAAKSARPVQQVTKATHVRRHPVTPALKKETAHHLHRTIDQAQPRYFFGTSIPQSYEHTVIKAIPRDPEWLFLYWELTSETVNAARNHVGHEIFDTSRRVLRLLDITGISYSGVNAHALVDVEINPFANNWYLKVPSAGRSYIVEYGAKAEDGSFYLMMRSNQVDIPRDTVSDNIDEEWTTGATDDIIRYSAGPTLGSSERLATGSQPSTTAKASRTINMLPPGSSENLFSGSSMFL